MNLECNYQMAFPAVHGRSGSMAALFHDTSFTVRYAGCMHVSVSMKSLQFADREELVKECIIMVAEAAALITKNKKRKISKTIKKCIGTKPDLTLAGTNVKFQVSTSGFAIHSLEDNYVIAMHEMPFIAFASGGDGPTVDFVAYVAKDVLKGRCCYVLECFNGTSERIVAAIGDAFKERFKEALPALNNNPGEGGAVIPGSPPGSTGSPTDSIPLHSSHRNVVFPSGHVTQMPPSNSAFSSPLQRPPLGGGSQASKPLPPPPPVPQQHLGIPPGIGNIRRPYENDLFQPSINYTHSLLLNEPWYHGKISRQLAEEMVAGDGDFLVRQSTTEQNQFVLTGVQHQTVKHLALIDNKGNVRMVDQEFDSVLHLIKYHFDAGLPITSKDSSLFLKNAIYRSHPLN